MSSKYYQLLPHHAGEYSFKNVPVTLQDAKVTFYIFSEALSHSDQRNLRWSADIFTGGIVVD
jgi:hypothetical protein